MSKWGWIALAILGLLLARSRLVELIEGQGLEVIGEEGIAPLDGAIMPALPGGITAFPYPFGNIPIPEILPQLQGEAIRLGLLAKGQAQYAQALLAEKQLELKQKTPLVGFLYSGAGAGAYQKLLPYWAEKFGYVEPTKPVKISPLARRVLKGERLTPIQRKAQISYTALEESKRKLGATAFEAIPGKHVTGLSPRAIEVLRRLGVERM